jgi:hypothetical protein
MKLTIKGKEIELKYSIRSLIMYENMAEKSFAPETLTDIITFMYCVVVSSNKDYSLTFDEFIDFLDENPDAIKEFSDWLLSNANSNENFKKN